MKKDLPKKWGFIHVKDGKCRQQVGANTSGFGEKNEKYRFEKNARAEIGMLMSVIRRLEIRGYLESVYEGMEGRGA